LEQEADTAARHVLDGTAHVSVGHGSAQLQRSATANASGAAPESVGRALSSAGQQLSAASSHEMSGRFGHDLSGVRVHTGTAAAASANDVGAKAYTVGSDIVFGDGQYAPDTRAGKQLLAHELTHVVQQSGDAEPYVARAVDDWLTGSVNVSSMSYTSLLAEIDELTQYLERQTASSPETARIEQVLVTLRAEANRQEAAAAGPRPRGRAGTRPATTGGSATLPARYPRILTEMHSIAYSSPEEMREELNLIMQWLARDLSREERRILTAERDNLMPLLRADRDRVVAERHTERVRLALTPAAEEEARALETLARTIEGITNDPTRSDVAYIYHQGERIAIGRQQAAQLRDNLNREIRRALRGLDGRVQYYWDRYQSQLSLNRESPIVAGISGWLGARGFFSTIEDPADEINARYYWMFHRVRSIEAQLTAGRNVEAAAQLARIEIVGQEIGQLSRGFYEGYIEGAGSAVTGLEFTRDASFAVAASIGAVVAAPVVAGVVGVGGLGVTGAGATILSTGGTALVVGTGTAVVRGGSAAVGEGVAGGTLDQAANAFWREGRRGFREGFLAGGAGAAARLLGPALGVGTNLGQQALRRIAAEAIVNGTTTMIDVLVQGGSLEQAVTAGARAAALSAPSALIGGVNNPIARYLVAPLTAGGTAYLGARAAGVEPREAMANAAVAIASNLAMSRAAHSPDADAALVARGREMGASTREAAVSARRSVASFGAAVMIGTSDALPPLRSGYGGTSVVMPGDMSGVPAMGSSVSSSAMADAPDTFEVTTPRVADADAVAPATPASIDDATSPVRASSDADAAVASARPDTEVTATADSAAATTATNPADDLNIDAALSPDANYSTGDVSMTGRTQASGRSRNFASLARLVLTGAQRLAAIALHGQLFNVRLRAAWTNTRNAREIADLQRINTLWNNGQHQEARVLARQAFDRHRGRFWRMVRADPALRAVFTDAGMVFPPGRSGAPIYVDPTTGDQLDFMSLEHQVRLADDPARALDAANLQTVLGDENSVTLEWIRRNDPFQ